MRIILKNILILLLLGIFSSCDDFFITDPDDIYSTDDYPSNFSELYAGYIGMITRLQEVGDHAIFLTELRGDFLEPSENATLEMLDVYNYGDLKGNSFADPRGYYLLIISCNDFINKAFEYREKYPGGINEEHFAGLVGGAIRFKVWAYFTLGKIYGKAIYFDDPLVGLGDLSKYEMYDLDKIIDKCLELMDVGVNGIDGTGTLDWSKIIAPDNPYVSQNYFLQHWERVTPDYRILLAELCLWKEDFQRVYDLILPILNQAVIDNSSRGYTLNSQAQSRYAASFPTIEPYRFTMASYIWYDAKNGQTNRLMTYLEDIYPNEYRLRASKYGVDRYRNQPRSDGGTNGDNMRGGLITVSSDSTKRKVNKYYSRSRGDRLPYESDTFINFWRSHDMHFMLIEALNHLGNWTAASVLLNYGLDQYDPNRNFVTDTTSVFYGFAGNWAGTYKNLGFRGFYNLLAYDLPEGSEIQDTDPERIKAYDMAILDEMILEFLCEGKSYPQMIRMARRYGNDWSIIADRICPKYPPEMQDQIRQKIMSGAYFVEWDLYTQ